MAFPTLLQSQAATGLLSALTEAESQRKVLLVRRTLEDEDVKALTSRITEIESQLRAFATTYLQSVGNQIDSYDQEIDRFKGQLRAVPERELHYARLEREPKILEGIYTMLQTRLKEAEVSAAVRDPSVRVVDAAVPPTRPVWPKRLVNLAAGLCSGLLVGVALALWRERSNDAVRSRSDVRVSTGLPVLGLIPRIKRGGGPIALIAERAAAVRRSIRPPASRRSHGAASPILGRVDADGASGTSIHHPVSADTTALTISAMQRAAADAYGVLRTNIAFARTDPIIKTLVFTSPFSGDGKTTTVINLAITLCHRGLKVLVIDADLRRGAVHTILGGARHPGLTEVLQGTAPFEIACRVAQVGEDGLLHYLPAGDLGRQDIGLAASEPIQRLLQAVRDNYDLILLDTPPVSVIADAAQLGAIVDGVVVVARAGITESTALAYAVEQLHHVGAPVLGVVLNDIDLRRDAAYDKVYRYFENQYTAAASE